MIELLKSGGWLMVPILLCSVVAAGICIERLWSLRRESVAPQSLLSTVIKDLDKNFSFETRFYENQFYYPDYLKEKSDQRSDPSMGVDGIAFGIGRAKNFKNYGS